MNLPLPSIRYLLFVPYLLIGILFLAAYPNYPGQGYVFALFTLLASALLYFGFRKDAIFFDTFIGVFFWLGFWLKLTVRVAFMDSRFYVAVGNFDGSGEAFDRALLATSCGFLGLLVASYLRGRYWFSYSRTSKQHRLEGLQKFYLDNRNAILSVFVLLIIAVAISNSYFGIYQRGMVPRTLLPYGLGGIYTWLILFGLASITALVLHYEYTSRKRATYPVAIIGLLENFITNVSLLSRGMILNASALAYGLFRDARLNAIKIRLRFWVATGSIFAILFGCSVVVVNHLRTGETMSSVDVKSLYRDIKGNSYMATPLFLDRWVGIEGVMAISSHPNQGWELWREAWRERYSQDQLSFFDKNIIDSPYKNTDMTTRHPISLPGILAFCFYPGSFSFLFACMFLAGGLAAFMEFSVFKMGGGNLILCGLLAQVVASRYVHFGYVPAKSYLLFGTIFLNLFIIYFSNKFLLFYRNKPRAQQAHGTP